MKVFRHSPRSFQRALDAGVFGEQKVELLAGLPHVMTANPPHSFVVMQLAIRLSGAFSRERWAIFEEKYVRLGSWIPQPDVAVIRWPSAQYVPRLPRPADIRLIAEVSDATYRVDRGRKYLKYASVGIPEYWIVDLNARLVQLFTEPEGSGKSACYRTSMEYDESMVIPPPADAVEAVAVAEILPPRGASS